MQLLDDPRDLPIERFAGAVIINDEVGGGAAHIIRDLRGYPAACIVLIQPAVLDKSAHPLLCVDVDDDGGIHVSVEPFIDEERHVINHELGTTLASCLEAFLGFFLDTRVGNGVENSGFLGAGKSAGGQSTAIKAPIGEQNVLTEGLRQLSECRLAWLNDVTGDAVCIDQYPAFLHEEFRYGGFSAADSAGESNEFHTGLGYAKGRPSHSGEKRPFCKN